MAGSIFENTGNPQVDLVTGTLSGYAWGANVGWIILGGSGVIVETDRINPGQDSDSDGIADAFEFLYAGNMAVINAATDFDGDGVRDAGGYASPGREFGAAYRKFHGQ